MAASWAARAGPRPPDDLARVRQPGFQHGLVGQALGDGLAPDPQGGKGGRFQCVGAGWGIVLLDPHDHRQLCDAAYGPLLTLDHGL